MKLPFRHLPLVAVACLVACASPAGGGAAPGGDRAVIGAEALRAETGRRLDDVIRRQRPQWLARRGAASLNDDTDVVVYQDGVRLGGPAVLRNVSADIVESVSYLSGPEATTRFGTGHPHGALLIVTRH
jgi:hypothetical protein